MYPTTAGPGQLFDFWKKPLKSGQATVAYRQGTSYNEKYDWVAVDIEIHGRMIGQLKLPIIKKVSARLARGHIVTITYQEGRSGRVRLRDWLGNPSTST